MAQESEALPTGEPLDSGTDGEASETGAGVAARSEVSAGQPASSDEVAREVQITVKTILDLTGIRSRVDVEKSREEYYVNIRPSVSKGLLIGRRGTTLRAIQYLTRLIVKRKYPDVAPVMVDVGGYRMRRENFLCKKAEAVARIVMETRREMALDPLTDKERTLVEEHLRILPEVRVYSVATGSKQNVIIAPK